MLGTSARTETGLGGGLSLWSLAVPLLWPLSKLTQGV